MIAPVALKRVNDRALILEWNDGKRSEFNLRALRLACPCASCVSEWTGKRTLTPDQVPEGVRPVRLYSVGRYALGVTWTDGHSTGIFSYDYLRRLDEAGLATSNV